MLTEIYKILKGEYSDVQLISSLKFASVTSV